MIDSRPRSLVFARRALRCASCTALVVAGLLGGCSGGSPGEDTREPQDDSTPFAEPIETGLAIGNNYSRIVALGKTAIAAVSEQQMQVDLNGDGDTNDNVATIVNLTNGSSTNTGLAITGPVLKSDQHCAFLVPELDQGVDLSGDGDRADAIWHVFDPSRPLSADNPQSLGLATPLFGRPGVGADGGFILVVSEAAQGEDFSGDGDQFDDVLFAFDGSTFSALYLGAPPYAAGTPLVARGRHVLVAGSELSIPLDLNGDGDSLDIVLGAVVFGPTGTANYLPVGPGVPRAVVPRGYALAGNAAVYLIDEAQTGATDLNGDGDANDGILAVFDLLTASGEFLPTDPTLSKKPLAANQAFGIHTSNERVLFGIDEASNRLDINKDQDFADSILAWIDTIGSLGRVHNMGLALGTSTPALSGPFGLVTLSENASALVVGTDYNDDGDISDEIAFHVDMTVGPGFVRNLGLAAGPLVLQGSDAIVGVIESAQFNTDFNGDSDTNDLVPAYVNLAPITPALRFLGIATHNHQLLRASPDDLRILVHIPEQPFTLRADVNNDGDSLDTAHFWIDIDSTTTPASFRPRTPFLAGIGLVELTPPMWVDKDTLLFATSEFLAGRDLNGDGDFNDNVLRISVRLPEDE
jgi:hypothetical protein